MKKIINPWKDLEGYNCFGCAPNNESGVKMEFYEDGDEVVSIWKPRPEYQGWLNTLHGGIQSVLLDEICGWVVVRKLVFVNRYRLRTRMSCCGLPYASRSGIL